jgi:hypothetical protein
VLWDVMTTRDIDTELADLMDHFPVGAGQGDRVLYSRPDWDTWPNTTVT